MQTIDKKRLVSEKLLISKFDITKFKNINLNKK